MNLTEMEIRQLASFVAKTMIVFGLDRKPDLGEQLDFSISLEMIQPLLAKIDQHHPAWLSLPKDNISFSERWRKE